MVLQLSFKKATNKRKEKRRTTRLLSKANNINNITDEFSSKIGHCKAHRKREINWSRKCMCAIGVLCLTALIAMGEHLPTSGVIL